MPIRFEKTSFVYGTKTTHPVTALKDVDLEIGEGDFLAIVGRTGCGKSTLTQHMNALLNPTSGCVYIDSFVNSSDRKKRDKKTKTMVEKDARNMIFSVSVPKAAQGGQIFDMILKAASNESLNPLQLCNSLVKFAGLNADSVDIRITRTELYFTQDGKLKALFEK